MKCVIAVFSACVAMSFFDVGVMASPSTPRDEPSEDTRTCTMSTEDNDDLRFGQLLERMDRCITKGLYQVDDFNTLDQYRQYFIAYCGNVSTIQTCLEGVNVTAKSCLSPSSQLAFHVMEGMFMSVVNTGCENNGDNFSKFIYGFGGDEAERVVKVCAKKMKNDAPVGSQRMLVRYRNLQPIKDCILGEVGNRGEELKTVIRAFLDNLARDARCIHPQDGSLVLCSTIQTNDE